MTDQTSKAPLLGTLISLPTAIMLGVLFFLPWLELRCDMKDAAKMSGDFPKEMELVGKGITLAHASGWQLTFGEIIPEQGPSDGKDKLSKVINARPWFILGLAVPVILLIGGGMVFQGNLAFRFWGKAMIVLGVVGVLLCVLGVNVDYADDLIAYNNEKREKLTSPVNMGGPYEQIQEVDQIAQFLRTGATPVLFSSGILYIIVIGCGFLLLREPYGVAVETVPRAPENPTAPPPDFGPSVYTPPKE